MGRTLLAVTTTKGVAKVLPEINLDIFALVPNLEQVFWNVLTTNISLATVDEEPVCAHGNDSGKDGYLIMSADWFRLYGGEADVRRQYVPEDLLKVWDEGEDVQIDFWENLGYSLGGRNRK